MTNQSPKFKIKKGDAVVVTSGKDKGKKGKVLDVLPHQSRILVEGVALRRRHQRPRKAGQKGEIVSLPSTIHISNVMLYCGHCGRGVRVGIARSNQDQRRFCKKCDSSI